LTDFRKILNIKLQESPFSGSQIVPHRRTDVARLTVAFRNLSNATINQITKKEQREYGADNGSPYLHTPHTTPAYANRKPVDCEEYHYCVDRMARRHKGNEGLGEIVYPLLSTAS
jgi:hypothetical protein